MTINTITKYFLGISMILTGMTLSAQQTEIEYNSDTGAAGPQLLIQESGDGGDEDGEDGWARMWFKNTADPINRWGFLARPHAGATDNPGDLMSPLVMAYTGVQKFGFGMDGTLRINKQYSFPNMDGTAGQVLTTDGAGNVSWSDAGSGSSFWTQSSNDIRYTNAGTVLVEANSTNSNTGFGFYENGVRESLIWHEKNSGDMNFTADNSSSSRHMVIDGVTQNVGIGLNNSNPSQKLDVSGKIEIADDASPATEGAIRYLNGKFEGYNGTEWESLNSPKTVTNVYTSHALNPGDHAEHGIFTTQFAYFSSAAIKPAFRFSLPIPTGSTLKKVSFIVSDNSTGNGSGNRLLMALFKDTTIPGGGSIANIAGSALSVDSGTNYQIYDLNLNQNVGINEAFFVRIYATDPFSAPVNWPGFDIRISKIIVEYEAP
jgi:hypothetical protein